MSSSIDELIHNAAEHEAAFAGPGERVPAKRVAIVTCMDARIDIFRIFGLERGQAHILRNAGGLVTEDVLRSLLLSQRLLGTREIILMHHTHCGLDGANEAALHDEIAASSGDRLPYALGAFSDVDEAVRDAMTRVREHRFLPYRDAVRGFVYDVATGGLREVRQGPAGDS